MKNKTLYIKLFLKICLKILKIFQVLKHIFILQNIKKLF